MAEVTGRTAESIDELMNAMVTSVRVDDQGQLIYKTRGGQETNTGSIVSAKLAVAASHPIGSIYIGTTPANPSTLLGIGTWVRFGKGRALVGLDEDQAEFNAPEKEGGAKSVTLTAAQSGMPNHAHTFAGSGTTSGMNTGGSINTTPDPNSSNSGSRPLVRAGGGSAATDVSNLNHTHTYSFSGATGAASANASQAHSILSPYITVYLWKRTA